MPTSKGTNDRIWVNNILNNEIGDIEVNVWQCIEIGREAGGCGHDGVRGSLVLGKDAGGFVKVHSDSAVCAAMLTPRKGDDA